MILLMNKDGSMATGVWQLAEACQNLFRICFVQQVNKNAKACYYFAATYQGLQICSSLALFFNKNTSRNRFSHVIHL